VQQLDNVQVFAASVARIMDQLYRSFPLPCQVSWSELEELYGPSAADKEPRVLQPGEADYESLLDQSFRVETALAYVAFESYSENVNARSGHPIWYWTPEQRRALRDLRQQMVEVTRIFDATLEFLLREQYIHRASEPLMPGRGCDYVLTSKGFAHLNKRFEGGTIRDEFQHQTSSRVLQIVKGGGDVATAGKALVDALSTFFT
jgi:hypothetical protein